jgi:hypothetical protein
MLEVQDITEPVCEGCRKKIKDGSGIFYFRSGDFYHWDCTGGEYSVGVNDGMRRALVRAIDMAEARELHEFAEDLRGELP